MSEFLNNIHQLHFIRPWAWLLLLPAIGLFLLNFKNRHGQSGWNQLIDQHLLKWLLPNSENPTAKKWLNLSLFTFWLLAIAALSGPSWQQLPQPTFSSNNARIVVLDLSLSMDATDLKPSRLHRAKFKLTDLLEQIKDGQTGFVAYAGDAFTLSPLTTDSETISNLLEPLNSSLMPIKGSQPQLGIDKAIELLVNAGQKRGEIIWFTDGADPSQLKKIEQALSKHKYQLKILTLGTTTGAPIKQAGSGFLKDKEGNIVIPRLNYAELASFAERVNATITPLASDNSDIELLLEANLSLLDNEFIEQDLFTDSWQDSGFWLIILLLPIALYGFKNPNIMAALLLVCLTSIASTPTAKADILDELFLNENQKGKKQLKNKEYDKAYNHFQDPSWKSVAAYKNEDYQSAVDILSAPKTAVDYYNKANALTRAGEYDEALKSYEEAIELDPDFEDAKANHQIAQKLKEQQEQQSEDGEQSDEEQEGEQQDNQSESENQESQDSEQQSDSEQEAESKEEQQQPEEQNKQQQEQKELTPEEMQAQYQEQEKDQELEQWLKRISDDPGRLLREKMQREYRRRGHKQHTDKKW